jgi:hypothetical protein
MATNTGGTQGGSHEQHVKAGAQSHKNAGNPPGKSASSGTSREKTAPGQRSPAAEQPQGKPGHQGPKGS